MNCLALLLFAAALNAPSPDGRHIVSIKAGQDGPELWLSHTAPGTTPVRLLEISSSASAQWAPDSQAFFVHNRESSSSAGSYIYDTNGKELADLRERLVAADPDLAKVSEGHFYVEAQRWLDARTVRLAAYGHTDESPVQCFRFIYTADKTGAAKRVSRRITPATAALCDESSE